MGGRWTAGVGRGRSEAQECCSERTTPGGGRTRSSLWLHLEEEDRKLGNSLFFTPKLLLCRKYK